MRRTSIIPGIDYLEPLEAANYSACSGMCITAKTRVVIDTNMGQARTEQFLREFQPDVAFISHYHLDHSVWGALVLEHTSADLLVPADEQRHISSLDYFVQNTAAEFGLGSQWRGFAADILHFRDIEGYSTYDSPCTYSFSGIGIECLRTPGHSPAHSSFYFPDHKILFTGDMGLERFGPWYGWTDCSIEDLIESILYLRSLRAGIVLTSHGGIISRDISSAWDSSLAHILRREKGIREKLDSGKSKAEIVDEGVYFKNKAKAHESLRPMLTLWDSIMFDKHAAILLEKSLPALFPALGVLDACR